MWVMTSSQDFANNQKYSGLIISGGWTDDAKNSVEVYVPSTGQHCQLPDIPDPSGEERVVAGHSQEGLMACGGYSTPAGCLTLIDGTWERTTHLLDVR